MHIRGGPGRTSTLSLRIILIIFGGLVVVGSLWTRLLDDSGARNLYTYQAQAFLRGELALPDPLYDTALYKGHCYVPFPPFPAVVLLPFVALLGIENTRVMAISLAISLGAVAVMNHILKNIGVDRTSRPWILAAFFLGTGYWFTVRHSGGVWHFAQVIAVACFLLALNEALGKSRPALTGLLLGLAFLSRQLFLYHAIFLGIVLWTQAHSQSRPRRVQRLLVFAATLGIAVAASLVMNYLRFDNPLDTGYAYIPTWGFLKARVERFGQFHPAYLPYNFVHMFIQGFHITFRQPDFLHVDGVDLAGTSLTFASPFVFVALKAKWDRPLLWGAWISIALSLFHMLFYYNNGWAQLNTQRFSLDFLPLLMVLVALGTRAIEGKIWKAAVAYSIALNALSLFFIPLFNTVFP